MCTLVRLRGAKGRDVRFSWFVCGGGEVSLLPSAVSPGFAPLASGLSSSETALCVSRNLASEATPYTPEVIRAFLSLEPPAAGCGSWAAPGTGSLMQS